MTEPGVAQTLALLESAREHHALVRVAARGASSTDGFVSPPAPRGR